MPYMLPYVLCFSFQKPASIVRFETGTLFVVHRILKFGQIRSSSGRCDWGNHGSSRHVERMSFHVTAHHCDVIHLSSSPLPPKKHTGNQATNGNLLCTNMNWTQTTLERISTCRDSTTVTVSSRALPRAGMNCRPRQATEDS